MHQPTGVSMAPLPVAQQTNKQSAPRRDSDKLRLLAVFMFVLSVASIWGLLQRSSCLQQQPHQLSLAAGGRLADSKVPLVFAAVNGLDPADASVFVRSAFKYLDTRTRIVLATDSSNPANAYLYGLQRRYDRIRVLNSSMADISVPCGDEDMPLSVYLSRFVVLRDFLAEEGGRYSVVIACDARDTAFQADVFARPLVQAAAHVPMVVAGVEDIPRGAGFGDATISLAEEKNWNQRWLNTCFGASSYNNTQRRAIVCSGFLVGHVVAMEELSRTIVQVFQDTCCRAEQRGLDQGILNWLVHFAPPSAKRGLRLELAQNGDVVFSMSNTAYLNEMTYNEGNLIVNAYTKQPFPVIHQFDRVHEYIPVIKSLYPPLGGSGAA